MKKKFPTIAIGVFLTYQMVQTEDEPRHEREANADREVRREDSRPGERERYRAPDEHRVRGDREVDRRPDREIPSGVRFRREGDHEGGVRPPREGEGDRPPFAPRDGGSDSPPHGRQPFQQGEYERDRPQCFPPQLGRELA